MQPKKILDTPRLYLREMMPDDAENAYLLNLDPEVLLYTGDRPFADVEDARAFLSAYDQYRRFGVGRWAVILKENDDFLGFCGLRFHEDEQVHDIGFRFMKKHWNKGYATEAATACLNYGFDALKLERIVAHAMKENHASIRVLQKLGLEYVKDITCAGAPAVLYQIYNKTEQQENSNNNQ